MFKTKREAVLKGDDWLALAFVAAGAAFALFFAPVPALFIGLIAVGVASFIITLAFWKEVRRMKSARAQEEYYKNEEWKDSQC